MPDVDLPDINVWLALTCGDHQHHLRARRYWERERSPARLLPHHHARFVAPVDQCQGHAKRPFTPAEAWKIYRDFSALPEVVFLTEPTDVEVQFAAYSEAATFPANRWTDAYLAGFAYGTGCRLASFDAGFHRFPDFEFLHLQTA